VRFPRLPRPEIRLPRPSRRLAVIVAGAAGAVVLAVLVAVVIVRSADAPSGGASAGDGAGGPEAVAPATEVQFPEVAADAEPAEPRIRPVGVRSTELALETSVVGAIDLPTCDGPTGTEGTDRARWFDPGDGAAGRAVAPGEHGVAVIVGAAALADTDATTDGAEGAESAGPMAGLGMAVEGTLFEVARIDGTVLRWRAVDVVRLPVGTPFPEAVLSPAAEQRLLLVACGARVDGGTADVYVLALRAR